MSSPEEAWREHIKEQFGGLKSEHDRLLAQLNAMGDEAAVLRCATVLNQVASSLAMTTASLVGLQAVYLSAKNLEKAMVCTRLKAQLLAAFRSAMVDITTRAKNGANWDTLLERASAFNAESERLYDAALGA